MQIVTEPTIQAAIGTGDPSTLLVDTGSSGLVVPWQELGTNDFSALEELFKLGLPENFGFSGYSGGVEYLYLTYDGVPVDYGTDGTDVLTTTSPVDVEVLSWSTNPAISSRTSRASSAATTSTASWVSARSTAGPTDSPFESYGGVLVDLVGADKQLIVGGDNPLTGGTLLDGSPIVGGLTETVTDSAGNLVGSGTVTNDLDSGGVYGTIPSSIAHSGGLHRATRSRSTTAPRCCTPTWSAPTASARARRRRSISEQRDRQRRRSVPQPRGRTSTTPTTRPTAVR